MISVRKLLFSVFCGILALLIFVGILGLMQFRLTDDYNRVIEQGGKILFRFNMVREHITQAMLEKNWQNLETGTKGIETLNSDLTNLLDNSLIPKEYKIAIINQVDLPGIVLLNRRLLTEPDKKQLSFELHGQLRIMSDQLMRFDRVLAAEMKAQLVRFQNVAIGVLTVIVAAISMLLLFLYQKGFAPLISLSKQLRTQDDMTYLQPDPKACREVRELTDQVNTMLKASHAVRNDGEKNNELSPEKFNDFNNQLNGIINYAQLLIDEEQQGVTDAKNVTILEKILSSGEVMTSILQDKRIKE